MGRLGGLITSRGHSTSGVHIITRPERETRSPTTRKHETDTSRLIERIPSSIPRQSWLQVSTTEQSVILTCIQLTRARAPSLEQVQNLRASTIPRTIKSIHPCQHFSDLYKEHTIDQVPASATSYPLSYHLPAPPGPLGAPAGPSQGTRSGTSDPFCTEPQLHNSARPTAAQAISRSSFRLDSISTLCNHQFFERTRPPKLDGGQAHGQSQNPGFSLMRPFPSSV